MLKKVIGLMVFVLFIAAGAAQAKVSMTYATGGKQYFTMSIPDDWRVNVGSETAASRVSEDKKTPTRLISAMPNDGVPLWFGIWVPEHLEKIDGAEEFMDSLGLHLLDDVVVAKRNFDTLNSMNVYYISGTGKKEGEPMDFRSAFIQLSEETVVIAIYIGPHETTISHGDELIQMINSLQSVIR